MAMTRHSSLNEVSPVQTSIPASVIDSNQQYLLPRGQQERRAALALATELLKNKHISIDDFKTVALSLRPLVSRDITTEPLPTSTPALSVIGCDPMLVITA